MSEITTAHLALGIAAMGVVSSVGTAVGMFMLNRLFGSGDKADSGIAALKDKVHDLELAVERSQTQAREHVAGQYARREDVQRLERVIVNATEAMNTRMGEYTAAVTAMLGPIADQLGVAAVRKGDRG